MPKRSLPGLATILLLLLAACTTAPAPRAPEAEARREPLVFAVAAVEVADNSSLPANTNFITKRRSAALARRAEAALRERIRAGGGPGLLRVVIEKALLVERPLETTPGIAGLFLRETAAMLEASLTARLSVLDEDGFQRAFARVKVERSRPVPEGTTVAGRDALARDLVGDLMAQFQESLDRSVEDNLAAFLVL